MNPLAFLGSTYNELLFRPIINLLVFFINFVESLGIPGGLGISIIFLTLVIRLLVWPFMSAQIRSAKKLAELKPHMDVLKAKHKGDRQALSQAQMALYKEHGYNPAGGCLPSLIQLFVVWALAQAVPMLFDHGIDTVNAYLYPFVQPLTSSPNPHFLGFDLSTKIYTVEMFSQYWMFLLIVPLLTAALTFVQAKMMIPQPVKTYKSDSPKEKKEKEDMEDTMSAVQGQMVVMMPIMIAVFSYQLPIGLALYWNVMTIVGIIQQYMISGWGGMSSLLPSKK